ncbi:MAG TPA: 3-oxoacyl-[acyl-carrier-protein] reductase [Firmicutes bacterium]|nr:3-oxoacyl-[acyl-carrier-protein] reductase [Bacillota bacterium]
MRLAGKVALVTGASGGIGQACAQAFAREGADVALVAGRNLALAEEAARKVEGMGRQAMVLACDVSSPEAVEQVCDRVWERFSRVDVLVNNAGIRRDNFLIRMTDEEWDDVLRVNLRGVFNFTRAVGRRMFRQRSGRIINISSVAGVMGNAGQANYSAAKAGVIGLTKAAARELAVRGVTVNAVAPGLIDAGMTTSLKEDVKAKLLAGVPLGRLGTADEVAAACVFLASDEAGYITGQVLCVDGGMAM